MRKIIIVLVLLVFGTTPVFAHPFLDDTIPPASSMVSPGVNQIIIYYSEAVDVNFSVIKVLDGNGNQIDSKDTRYNEGETSLAVTTPPLEEGVYTVTTKVLSKVDGHLVDYAFVFGVGDVTLDTAILEQQENSASVFIPESAARFPGLVGQTIVLGGIISSIVIWNAVRHKRFLSENLELLEKKYYKKFYSLIGIGILGILASNFAMLGVQTWRLETSLFDAIGTSFGMTWTFRMVLTVALLGFWFVLQKSKYSFNKYIMFLLLSLILIGTTTMMGHAAASEQIPAIILDYAHNLLSSIWIGGVIFFAFVLLPTYSILTPIVKEKITLVTIPKFSKIITISLGILLITGPSLLWFLESSTNALTSSSYGFILIGKITIAAGMIGLGVYHQFKILRKGKVNLNLSNNSHGKLNRSLKIEVMLGIVLLALVALLTNSSLPAGEIQQAQTSETISEFRKIDFSQNAKFDIRINPMSSGKNSIDVSVSDFNDKTINDINGMKIKLSNPSKNISPIEIPVTQLDPDVSRFQGDITFGFSGMWKIELEVQRTQNANENLSFNVLIKPHIENVKTELTEYEFPEEATPLFPIFDGDENIWVSDPLEPRIWKFNIETEKFTKYEFDGLTSITLEIDDKGRIWFTDIPEHKIGYFDPINEKFKIYDLPPLTPLNQDSIPIALLADNDGNIWVSITNKNKLVKFDPTAEKFTTFELPIEDSGPFALELGPSGKVWFSQTLAGAIGFIDPKTEEVREFLRPEPLKGPEDIIFDDDGNMWIAEHTGTVITKFNPILETFESRTVPDSESLPFGMIFDQYKNLWFAQHVIDKIGVYDIQNNEILEVDIPTSQSFVQFITKDLQDNIWLVEQQGNKLAKITLTETPNLSTVKKEISTMQDEIKYADIVGPSILISIVLASLFFIKSVKESRFLDSKFP